MKIRGLVILLFLVGCTTVLEMKDFEALNQKNGSSLLDGKAKFSSCKRLKENGYDIFYSTENQKCISDYGNKIAETSSKVAKAKSNAEKIELIDAMAVSYEKFNNCKITKELTVGDLGKEYVDSKYYVNHGLISYFEEAYDICKKSEDFHQEKVERIVKEYKSLANKKEDYYKQKSELVSLGRTLFQQKQQNDKINALLSNISSNPILSKMSQTALDFMMSKIDECPLIFFVQALKDYAANFNSDLSSVSNYQFSKKGANTLIMQAGEMEMTFVKQANNKIAVTVLKDVDGWGNLITSKNIFSNNLHVQSLCNTYKNDDGSLQKYLKN